MMTRLLGCFSRFAKFPGGHWCFSKLIGWAVPYTNSIHPFIEELRPGFARVRISDRRGLRNHLGSIHAAALMNGAEAASGLALNAALAADARAILVKFTVQYLKKARGTLLCEAITDPSILSTRGEIEVVANIRNEEGIEVARAIATWRVSERKKT